MCMDFITTENLPTKTTAWKVMLYDGGWKTPLKRATPRNNKLKAKGKPDIRRSISCGILLSGGAIHCFKTKTAANRFALPSEAVFEIRGKNPIARNRTQIAFQEIEFVDNINDLEI